MRRARGLNTQTSEASVTSEGGEARYVPRSALSGAAVGGAKQRQQRVAVQMAPVGHPELLGEGEVRGSPVARATSSSGIRSLRMRNGATGINTITVSGRDLTLPIATGDIPLRIAIELGDVSVSEGTCAEKHFIAAQCALNTASNAVVCRD